MIASRKHPRARAGLLDELGKKVNWNFILAQKFFYKFGNKSGKLLARALWAKKAATTIHSITDPYGRKLSTNLNIANQFLGYYSQLYNPSKSDPYS